MNIGLMKGVLGSPDAGNQYLLNAIRYYRHSGDRAALGLALNNLSYNLYRLGDYSAAATHLDEAWSLAVASGDKMLQTYVMHSRAKVAAAQNRPVAALTHYEKVLKHCQAHNVAYSLDALLNEKNALTVQSGQRAQRVSKSIVGAVY